MFKKILINMVKPKKLLLVIWVSLFLQSSLAQALQVEKNVVLIPAGEFLMGTEEGTEIERPIHKVYLEEYKISRFEVSNREFEKFSPNYRRSKSSSCDRCPVTMVNWFEADSYCKSRGGRLPTEEEWEKAGRGPAGHSYSFGVVADKSKSNYGRDFLDGAKVVNSFQPNGFGLYNMSGNVWEWVNDWFVFYSIPGLEKPKVQKIFNEKILRGGSWYNSAYYVNVGMRFKLSPHIKLNSVGFRCVWEAQ